MKNVNKIMKRNKMKGKQYSISSKKQEGKKMKSNWDFMEFRCLGSNPGIDNETNDIVIPPVEDKVTDAIIYNSYVECGDEVRATKNKFGEEISQWAEKSNKLLEEQQRVIYHTCHTSPMALNAKNELEELEKRIRNNWKLSTNCDSYLSETDHVRTNIEKNKSERRVIHSDLNPSIMPVSSLEIPMDMTPMYESNTREARRKKNMYLRNQSKELKQRISKRNDFPSHKTEQRMTQFNPRESLSCVRENETKTFSTINRKEQKIDNSSDINMKPKESETTLPTLILSNEDLETNKYSCNMTQLYPSPFACFEMKNESESQKNQSPKNETILSLFQNKFKPNNDIKSQSKNKTISNMSDLSKTKNKHSIPTKTDTLSLSKENESKYISSERRLSLSPQKHSTPSQTNSNTFKKSNTSNTRNAMSLPPSLRSCQRTRMRRLTGMTQT